MERDRGNINVKNLKVSEKQEIVKEIQEKLSEKPTPLVEENEESD
jgi:hypothetical protein